MELETNASVIQARFRADKTIQVLSYDEMGFLVVKKN